MPPLTGSPYQRHVLQWQNCRRCNLCNTRKNVVLARGRIPCDVLLIGEGPGESEDVLAIPFAGPAGQLLDSMIADALRDSKQEHLRLAFTNLVACIPKNEETKRKNAEPLPAEIKECAPRLKQFIQLCKPDIIIAVGSLAEKYAKLQEWETRKVFHIWHPAALLRMSAVQQGMEIQRTIVKLGDAFGHCFNCHSSEAG